MYFLIYTSYASIGSDENLTKLLEQARQKNKACGITGMLVYLSGTFIQLIEGDEGRVRSLYETIKTDGRHFSPVILMEDTIKERYFKDWSMGFKTISEAELQGEENYKCLNPPNKTNVQDVLHLFRIIFEEHRLHPPRLNA